MQIVSLGTFEWTVKANFSGTIMKHISKCHLLKFLPSMLSVKFFSLFTLTFKGDTVNATSFKLINTRTQRHQSAQLFLIYTSIPDPGRQ